MCQRAGNPRICGGNPGWSIHHRCRLLPPEDLSNPLRSVHRVKTVTCRNARNAMIPMKNDKSAISTHASKANAKDKPSIGSMLSLLVGRTRAARLTQ
jgi:hypothetical protein